MMHGQKNIKRKGNVSILIVGKRIKQKITFRKIFRPIAYKYKK